MPTKPAVMVREIDHVRADVMAGKVLNMNISKFNRAKKGDLVEVDKPEGYDDVDDVILEIRLEKQCECRGLRIFDTNIDTVTLEKTV